MANERAYTTRNTGTKEKPVWERWFAITVADAVRMSDKDGEEKNILDFIVEYVTGKIDELIGGASGTYDTLKEIENYIREHEDVADAMNAAISNKVDKVDGKGLSTNDYTTKEKEKLGNIAENANDYVHPDTHPATMIDQDSGHRFCSDEEKEKWSNAPEINFGETAPVSAPPNSIFFLIKS